MTPRRKYGFPSTTPYTNPYTNWGHSGGVRARPPTPISCSERPLATTPDTPNMDPVGWGFESLRAHAVVGQGVVGHLRTAGFKVRTPTRTPTGWRRVTRRQAHLAPEPGDAPSLRAVQISIPSPDWSKQLA
jgi:hypothetical protein